MDIKAGRALLRVVLVAFSLGFLALATGAGLMHDWHRLAFISIAWLDDSFNGTLGFIIGGIVCWILAGLL